MAELRTELERIANDDGIATSTKTIEQKQRNTIKRNITEILLNMLKEELGEDNQLLQIYRTKDGILVGIDNEKVGIITVEFKASIKSLDIDPAEEEEAYLEDMAQKAEKAKNAQRLKEQKIARQAEERALKAKIKALHAKAEADTEDLE